MMPKLETGLQEGLNVLIESIHAAVADAGSVRTVGCRTPSPWRVLTAAQAKVGRVARVEGGWAVDVEHRHASGLIEVRLFQAS